MFLFLPISGILDLEGDDDKLDLLNCSQLRLELLLLVFLLNLSFFLVLLLWLWLSRKDFVHSKSRNRAPQITMFKKMPAKITDAPLHPLYSEMIEYPSDLAGTFVNTYIKLGNLNQISLLDNALWIIQKSYIPWIKYWVKGANTNVPTPEPQTDIPVAKDLKLKKKNPSTYWIYF